MYMYVSNARPISYVAIGLPLRMRGHSPRLHGCEPASYQQALTLDVSMCNKTSLVNALVLFTSACFPSLTVQEY